MKDENTTSENEIKKDEEKQHEMFLLFTFSLSIIPFILIHDKTILWKFIQNDSDRVRKEKRASKQWKQQPKSNSRKKLCFFISSTFLCLVSCNIIHKLYRNIHKRSHPWHKRVIVILWDFSHFFLVIVQCNFRKIP